MSKLSPELANEFDKLLMEHRGYEVARQTPTGWDRCASYPPTEKGRVRAMRFAIAAMRENPGVPHRVRPVVSIDIDFAKEVAVAGLDEAIVLGGDVIDTSTPTNHEQLELPLAPPADGESLIVKPEGTEFAGTGYTVPDLPRGEGVAEVPYNYDQLSGLGDMPDPWSKR